MRTRFLAIHFLIPAVLLVIAPGCTIFRADKMRDVHIKVVAKSIPAGTKIFITGSGSALGNWDPGAVPMTRQPDGSWTKSIKIDSGKKVYFKITRGNWNTEALDKRDPQVGAFGHIFVHVDTTILLGFSKWMDHDAGVTHLKSKFLRDGYYGIPNA